jgi:hypothetical protein
MIGPKTETTGGNGQATLNAIEAFAFSSHTFTTGKINGLGMHNLTDSGLKRMLPALREYEMRD